MPVNPFVEVRRLISGSIASHDRPPTKEEPPASEGIGTLGTTLKRGLQHVAHIQDISGPDLSTDTDEITNHDSPDGVEEFIPTIKRTGDIRPARALAVRRDDLPGRLSAQNSFDTH